MAKPYRTIPAISQRTTSSFLARIKQSRPDLCWEWRGTIREKSGYGYFSLRISSSRPGVYCPFLAHRIAYRLFYGADPNELCVLHNCDNRKCCNPHHLFLGTLGDNNKDRHRKGRSAKGKTSGRKRHPESWENFVPFAKLHPERYRGELNSHSKLISSQVEEIRTKHAAGVKNMAELAREYGVKHAAISKIVKRRTWRHL